MKIGGVLQEPIIIEVLYASKHTVVALVEGVVYVKNDGDFMHPVSIPVGDGKEWMSFDSVGRMVCRAHVDAEGMTWYILPESQFDDAIRDSLLHDYESDEEEKKELQAIISRLHDVFVDELSSAQVDALVLVHGCEVAWVREEAIRLIHGELTRKEFIDYVIKHTQLLGESELNELIDTELYAGEEENG